MAACCGRLRTGWHITSTFVQVVIASRRRQGWDDSAWCPESTWHLACHVATAPLLPLSLASCNIMTFLQGFGRKCVRSNPTRSNCASRDVQTSLLSLTNSDSSPEALECQATCKRTPRRSRFVLFTQATPKEHYTGRACCLYCTVGRSRAVECTHSVGKRTNISIAVKGP